MLCDLIFTDECLKYVIENFSNEQGVRNLKRKIKDIISNKFN